MNKLIKAIMAILGAVMLISVAGCGGQRTLSGAYRSNAEYNKLDDGTIQPSYYYFSKDGTFMYCSPQVNSIKDDDSYYYGEVSRGTWKALGNNEFQLKMHDVYNRDYYSFKARLNGKQLHTYASAKDAKYAWDADNNTKVAMTRSDFMAMFKKARVSDQKGIQENGYTLADNPSVTDVANNPRLVGALVLANERGIDAAGSQQVEFMILKKDNAYQVGLGTKDGTLSYLIDGHQVTIKDGSNDYKGGKKVAIKELMDRYYSSDSDQDTIDDMIDHMKTTNMADDD